MDNEYPLLVVCTCLCFVSELLRILVNPLIALLTKYGKSKYTDLRLEINKLKHEMDKLSVTEDFAKYIKLQRKLNRLQDGLKSKVNNQLGYSLKIRYCISYGISILISILHIFISWSNWKTTVINLPENWLQPFSSLLSWPTSVPGGISVPVWLITSNITAKLISKSLIGSS